MEHTITPTVAEFRQQIAVMNARAQEDAQNREQDQLLIEALRLRVDEVRRKFENYDRDERMVQRNILIRTIINAAPCECTPAAPVECSLCQFTAEISKMGGI